MSTYLLCTIMTADIMQNSVVHIGHSKS